MPDGFPACSYVRGRGCRKVPLIPSAATGNVASFSEADAAVDGRLIRLSAYPHRLVTGTLGAAQIGEFVLQSEHVECRARAKSADRAQRRDQRVLAGCAVVARACSGATPSASDVRAREQRQRDLRRCLSAIRLIVAPDRLPDARAVFKSPASAGLVEGMSADNGTPSAAQVEAAASGRATHPQEPHTGGAAGRLNWLRAAVLGANDGIVSVAGIVIGVAGATSARGPIFTAGLAGMVAGAVSMALVSTCRSPASATASAHMMAQEKRELAASPQAELAELTALYEAKGLSAATARTVADRADQPWRLCRPSRRRTAHRPR